MSGGCEADDATPRVRLEQELAALFQTSRVLMVRSRAVGLQLLLRGLAAVPHSDVICSAYGSPTAAAAICAAGLQPRFVDCDEETGTIDPARAAAAIGPRSCALLVEHIAGVPADLTALSRLADAAGLALLADAGEAYGARWAGRPVAASADGTVFGAPLLPYGALVTFGNDVVGRQPAARIPLLQHTLRTAGEPVDLDDLRSERLRTLIAGAAQTFARRRVIAEQLCRALQAAPQLRLPVIPADAEPALACLTYLTLPSARPDYRDQLAEALRARGVRVLPAAALLPLQPCYRRRPGSYRPGEFAHAEARLARALDLPIDAAMTARELAGTVAALRWAAEGDQPCGPNTTHERLLPGHG